jgi:hypothetical protein
MFLAILVIGFGVFRSSGSLQPLDAPELPSRGYYLSILPNVSEGQDIEDAYDQTARYSELVPVWSSGTGASGFWEYAEKLTGWWGDTFVDGLIRGNGMVPIIHFSFIDKDPISGELVLKTPDSMNGATLNDSAWRDLYLQSVVDVVRAVNPLYLSTGNEVNRWYEVYGAREGDKNGFQHFVSLHEEIYDAVKAISPNTYVFCVFSREIVAENREADLTVLNMFNAEKLDILVFTTYPIAVAGVNQPSDIPLDYYVTAAEYMPDTLFGFSEIGWPTRSEFGGEQAQLDFLYNLSKGLTIDQGVQLHMLGYCWLHDVSEDDTTGLIRYDGTEKKGYQAWKSISSS